MLHPVLGSSVLQKAKLMGHWISKHTWWSRISLSMSLTHSHTQTYLPLFRKAGEWRKICAGDLCICVCINTFFFLFLEVKWWMINVYFSLLAYINIYIIAYINRKLKAFNINHWNYCNCKNNGSINYHY